MSPAAGRGGSKRQHPEDADVKRLIALLLAALLALGGCLALAEAAEAPEPAPLADGTYTA